MSAYRVWKLPGRDDAVWAESWHRVAPDDARDATPEEAALMDKVVWDNHSADDARALRALLASVIG